MSNIFWEQLLDDREKERHAAAARSARDLMAAGWVRTDAPPEERLFKFEAWIRLRLEEKFDWSWAKDAAPKRIMQCSAYLKRLVLDLWRRGWMLDGARLAHHLVKMLDAVAVQQRAGKVADFWPYFQTAVDRYVGVNAEELKSEAMRAGSHIAQALALMKGPTLPELVAQQAQEQAKAAGALTLREKLAQTRRKAKEQAQLPLL